jgi:hypothetical protein
MTCLAAPRHRARKDSSKAARLVRMIRTLCAREREKAQGACSAGTTAKAMICINTDDQVELASDGIQVKIETSLVALGSGAQATLGTVGGTGPVSTAQAGWEPFIDSTGAQAFRPVSK